MSLISSTPVASVAPMEGVTMFPMRLWLQMASQPVAMTTPFLRVTSVHPGPALPSDFAPELLELRGVLPYELTPQYLAAEPDNFLRAAELLPPEITPVIELNCGCPSPNSAGRHAGSGILRDPDVFGRTVERLASRLGARRLAVKMRVGFESPDEFSGLLPHIAGLRIARLTVHGRTRAAGYKGRARWDLVQAAARAKVGDGAPIHLSGDVFGSKSKAMALQEAPDVAGVMIGRGVVRNPWVFEELRSGKPIAIAPVALANALLVFALLNEVWTHTPQKLIGRLASGRLPLICGANAESWESLAAALTALSGSAPIVVTKRSVPDVRLSGVGLSRLKLLWSYLRTGLPEALFSPKLMRARSGAELLGGILALAEEAQSAELMTITHRPAWDELFSPGSLPSRARYDE